MKTFICFAETTDGAPTGPKYIGIAIGVGVCLCLFLLSGASVFLLNIKNGGGWSGFSPLQILGMKKQEDDHHFQRIPSARGDGKSKMLPMPMQRLQSGSSMSNQV